MVALSWIKADPSRWKAFVANRVVEIQTLTSPDRWLHCSGVENPADLLTRGVTAEELIFSKVWLQGPKFLMERRSDEVDLLEPSAFLCSVMAEETASPVLIAATPGENVFQAERWGKLTKAIRVVAWVLRFIFNSRPKQEDRRLGDVWCSMHDKFSFNRFSSRSLQRKWVLCSEADSISWWWGFVESAGQIAIFFIATWWEAPYSHPQESFCSPVDAVSAFHHETCWCFHFDFCCFRKSYWVFGLRHIAEQVKRMCVSCQRQDSAACTRPMAPLPKEWCCAPWTGWHSLDIWQGTSISAPGGAQRSAQDDLFW